MCGIVGFSGNNMPLAQKEDVLNKMLTRIVHRGPDEAGLYRTPTFGMGSVRLSIVDLGSGQQPLCNQDGNLWIAYNGEVYNHTELRQQLQSLGHQFKTNCDTEVVLHMYEEYGADCLTQLNGQFAFSIWDEKKQKLFLARDRFGIRPLFYTRNNDELIFASEIKCLFEYPNVEPHINLKGLKESFIFWSPLSPNTFFQNIKELPPGHYMEFSGGVSEIRSYWKHEFGINTFKGTFNEAAEELSFLLKSSIDLRLRADVQVAAYLSGGLDSSVVTALVKQIQPSSLNTFSIGFDDEQYDESNYQQEVSAHFNTRHKSISCSDNNIVDLLQKAIYHTEAPILRTSPVPMMMLSSLVRKSNIKVVLTGEGADEMLGGYNIFKEAIIRHFWAKDPTSKLRPLLLKRLYPYIPQLKNASAQALKLFFGYQLQNTESPVYSHLLRWKNGQNLTNLLSDDCYQSIKDYHPIDNVANSLVNELDGFTSLEKAQLIESRFFMSGYLLSSQGDRVAMANSVEGRYPFLDHRVAEFCSTLPDEFKIKGLNEKVLLKHMMRTQLPASVIKRPKQAYRAPVGHAIIKSSDLLEAYFSNSALVSSGLFNVDKLASLFTKIQTTNIITEQDNMALIAVLSTQMLYQQFIDSKQEIKSSSMLHADVKNK
ncbi:asparagine synthase (glutamine-hydrolyzing) [Carboxylicivirga sp. M1479]|uniref:asparagine synthase (glutamine-hydrolyzing) n=1 Tax=Carboxylicivirga sp. M1479 TaxID=2594476 RepID=UPI00117784A6|nr:asparagine synthase (glutamine-hydrolyzing) [Carboxylicivirga sp. M1479]TRX66344.1 asparagine synthase (glutamine-hydrolyzing) [Carboxylicivirga sp. M1479]